LQNVFLTYLILLTSAIYAQERNFIVTIHFQKPSDSLLIKQRNSKKIDSASIKNYLIKTLSEIKNQDYPFAEFDSIIFYANTCKAYLYLGTKTTIQYYISNDSIHFFNSKKQKLSSINELKILQQNALTELANQGYPFARITTDSCIQNPDTITFFLSCNPFSPIQFNKLVLQGNLRINERFLTNYFEIKKGKKYRQVTIDNISEKTKKLNFAFSTHTPEIEFVNQSATPYLYIERKKTNQFSGIAGIATNEKTGKIQISGNMMLQLENTLAQGEKIIFNWQHYEKQKQELFFSAQIPYIIGYPLGTRFLYQIEQHDTSYISQIRNIELIIHPSTRYTLEIGYKTYISTVKTNNNSFARSNLITKLYQFGIQTETIDNPALPRKGFIFNLKMGAGKKKMEDSTFNQYELECNAKYYLSVSKHVVVFTGTKLKTLISSTRIFENEMFYTGGIDNLKGFDSNFLPANKFGMLLVEPRWIYNKNSFLYLFAQAGKVINQMPYQIITIGAGTQLQTKSTSVILYYATNKINNNSFNLKEAGIHFGIINHF